MAQAGLQALFEATLGELIEKLKKPPTDAPEPLSDMLSNIKSGLENLKAKSGSDFKQALIQHVEMTKASKNKIKQAEDKKLARVVLIVHKMVKSRVKLMGEETQIHQVIPKNMFAIGAVIQTYDGPQKLYFTEIGKILMDKATEMQGVLETLQGVQNHLSLEWQAIHRLEALVQKLQ
jgi:hypothetical protein